MDRKYEIGIRKQETLSIYMLHFLMSRLAQLLESSTLRSALRDLSATGLPKAQQPSPSGLRFACCREHVCWSLGVFLTFPNLLDLNRNRRAKDTCGPHGQCCHYVPKEEIIVCGIFTLTALKSQVSSKVCKNIFGLSLE